MTFSRKVVAFSAAVELATGAALIAIPGLAGQLLLGAQLPPRAIVLARCFGVALLALSLAVWPGNDAAGPPFAPCCSTTRSLPCISAGWACAGTWEECCCGRR